VSLVVSSTAEGLYAAGTALYNGSLPLRNLLLVDPPEYTEAPTMPYEGDTPSRDDTTRFGIWDTATRELFGELEAAQQSNSTAPITTEPSVPEETIPPFDPGYEEEMASKWKQSSATITSASKQQDNLRGPLVNERDFPLALEGNVRGGTPYPWELIFPGGGSVGVDANVNSNTGNRQTQVHLFSIPLRGGFQMDMNLYHNSQATYAGQFGWDWSCDFDTRIQLNSASNPTLITVRWGDGTPVPFTWNVQTQKFEPPKGFYDSIVLHDGNNSWDPIWKLTTKQGVEYYFRSPDGVNPGMENQGILKQIKWPGSTLNVINVERSWNGSSRITKVAGPNSRNITFGHTTSTVGSVGSIKDSLKAGNGANRIWSFEYTTNGELFKIKNPAFPSVGGTIYAREFTYTTDNKHNIATEKDLNGGTFSSWYTGEFCSGYNMPNVYGFGILPSIYNIYYYPSYSTHNDPYYRIYRHNYSAGSIASTVDEAGFSDAYTVDPMAGTVTQYKDRRQGIWTYQYDVRGNLLQTTTPTGEHSYATYNTDNTVESSNGDLPVGSPSKMKYQYTNRVLNRAYRDLNPAQDVLTNAVNASHGMVDSSTSYDGTANSRTFSFWRNGYGDLYSTTDPNGQSVTTPTNEMGWVEYVIDQLGRTTDIVYDVWGRPSSLVFPDTKHIDITYDLEGNVLTVTDERLKTHTWTYNPRGQAIKYKNANLDEEQYNYNSSGFMVSVKNGRDKYRYYEPTKRDEVKKLTMPDGQKEFWQYDSMGDVGAYWGAYESLDQWTTTYFYDLSGRPTYINYPLGQTDTIFTYTNFGHNISMQDGTGTTTWVYDSWDDLTSLNTPQGATTYTYNRLGERLTMNEATFGTTTYEYDKFGRLKQLTNLFSEVTKWNFDDAGRMWKRELANGTWEEIIYDSRNRPTNIDLRKPGPVNLRTQAYTYDDASNVLSHTVEAITTTYEYDNINQLTREYKGSSASPTWQIAYDYDANGNRWHRNVLGGVQETYNNDDGDKLASVTWAGGSKSYTYDGAGRRKTETVGASTTNYTWDFESRIKEISKTGMTTNTMVYNGLDTRVGKTDSSGPRTYSRDGAYVTDPALRDISSNGTTFFTPGISERRSNSSRYLHSGIKNADSRTTTGTSVEANRSYDAFGNVISSTGTWQGFFGYAGGFGYQEEPDTGLKLLGHRYYDSTTGRFLSRDSIKEGRNWFSYCENDPISGADPSGLFNLRGLAAVAGAKNGVGKGPKDCEDWIRKFAYPGAWNDTQSHKVPKEANTFRKVPNDGNFEAGDLIIVGTGNTGMGHIMIVGDETKAVTTTEYAKDKKTGRKVKVKKTTNYRRVYDAAYKKRNGTARWIVDGAYKDEYKKRNGAITILRPFDYEEFFIGGRDY
jgi:RHS repeat-associated protein